MENTIENFKNAARSVETLEKELYTLESATDQQQRKNKSLIKQVDRLKQQMEDKKVSLEELGNKFNNLESEKSKLVRQLDVLAGKQTKMDTLKKEN